MADRPSMTYDGLEFKEQKTMKRYIATKNRFKVATLISIAAIGPALALLLLSYVEPRAYPQYLYLVFLAVSIPFSILSFQANSKLTEIINTNEVRHVAFG